MKIEMDTIEDVVILNLVGELDSRGNQQLDKTLKELVYSRQYKIILDISSIRFIGSQTISLLVSNLKEIRAGGGNIKLLNPQRSVLQYLKQQRIIEIFRIYSSRLEAVQSYKNEANQPKKIPKLASNVQQTEPELSMVHEQNAVAKTKQSINQLDHRLQTGEILNMNSCILASLIKTLESKGILISAEVEELLSYECFSLKGENNNDSSPAR